MCQGMLLDVHSLCLCAAVGKLLLTLYVCVRARAHARARVLCILDYYCISECL